MNMKKILIICLASAMMLSLASCKDKDCTHVDADDDYLCDNCGENFDDGDEGENQPAASDIKVSFLVKLDDGTPLAGVKFTVARGEKSFDLVSAQDGTASLSVPAGAYSISYDYDTLPVYCTPDLFGFKVQDGMGVVNLLVVNNTPDGSQAKPFPVLESELDINLPAGEKQYFTYRGSSMKILTLNSPDLAVEYNGETYTAVDGVVTVVILPDIGVSTTYAIVNNSASEISTTMYLIAPLGSSENPIELTSPTGSSTVSEEQTIYYKWVADSSGVLVLTCDNEKNNISMTKTLENDILVITQTAGDAASYMVVSEGDEIVIGVSAINTPEKIEIVYNLDIYAGTYEDAVPVLVDELSITMDVGTEIHFSAEAGKTLTLSDESSVAILHDSLTYTNEGDIKISVTLSTPIFVVRNDSDSRNGITFKVK